MAVILFFSFCFFIILVSSVYVGVSVRHLWQQHRQKSKLANSRK